MGYELLAAARALRLHLRPMLAGCPAPARKHWAVERAADSAWYTLSQARATKAVFQAACAPKTSTLNPKP